ncbi:MAG TPA: hypothetical protein VEB22_07515 [Phycisphaerales bacterium]|nr:hypothetical protein [Phycisphaerales bacterium]
MRIPVPLSEFIPWSTAHAELWAGDPAAVGMTQQQADAVKLAAESARAAQAAALAARQLSLNATFAQEQAERALRRAVQTAVVLIDVCAENSPSPAAVYSAAELDSPTVARTVPAPGKVKQLTASLDPLSGAPVLRWKGNNPRGGGSVTYLVARRLSGQREFSFVGTAAPSGPNRRTFTDTSVPVGTAAVSYLVHAVRGAAKGEAEQIDVRFGSVGAAGPGEVGGASAKMAA